MLRRARLPAALLAVALGQQPCQVGLELVGLEGVAGGRGKAKECFWHINPDLWLDSINFQARDFRFEGLDRLDLYTAMPADDSRRVATFNAFQPIPQEMTLTGSNEVVLVLTAAKNTTFFVLNYKCIPAGHRFGGVYLSDVAFISVIAALAMASLLIFLLPLYLLCFCRAKRRQEAALSASELVAGGELARRRREEVARRALLCAAEQLTVGALQALPCQQWSAVDPGEAPEDCSLCLEHFKEDDTLRVLPCSHYFHKGCIDPWFASRRFMPRSCPLCRRSPILSPSAAPAASGVAAQGARRMVGTASEGAGAMAAGESYASEAAGVAGEGLPSRPPATAYGRGARAGGGSDNVVDTTT